MPSTDRIQEQVSDASTSTVRLACADRAGRLRQGLATSALSASPSLDEPQRHQRESTAPHLRGIDKRPTTLANFGLYEILFYFKALS